eukprot:TRINITY_DN71254_c0_g1_i1.p1 TRINITY_DN71254_c0_g1~~TRINITY_DN71254_c0_g1_i1.p1  ORF type:complete len:217 (+),score=47.85 TRINITY_DN71254_c0_g1_i1:119-769(+)
MKIVLIGDSSVGKSALVYRFIHNSVLVESKATVGIAFFKMNMVDFETGQEYPLQIWDTAGQEKFQSVTTHHYRAADGALLVFDISNEQSFNNLDKWLNELRENTDPNVVVALVGTKWDLTHQRKVHSERAAEYARMNNLFYVETSAYLEKEHNLRTKELVVGVDKIFLLLLRGIVQQQRENGRNPMRMDMSGYNEANGNRMRLNDGSRDSSSDCAC